MAGEEPSHTALRVSGLKTSRTNKGSRVGAKKVPVSSTHFNHCWWAGYGDKAGVSGPCPGRGSSSSAFPGQSCLELFPRGHSHFWTFWDCLTSLLPILVHCFSAQRGSALL